ncbi:hypothetical protein AB1Y20_019568 [Prymnesium parvum]|uniref:Uncharacterized protein n=1 Tax=Prymnesium parvum TaxID=97485 RepID=A0AB34JUT1_PRYPA
MALPAGQRTIGPHFVPEGAIQGMLFDCDGTLLNTMPLFFHSWEEVCPQFGLRITIDDFYAYAGWPLPSIVRDLHQRHRAADASDDFVASFLAAKQAAHERYEAQMGHPEPIGCVVKLAREAAAAGIPVCIATSGLRTHVEPHLAAAGLDDLFNPAKGNIVCAADVPKGKPAPDIYLEAARRIGADPRACRAFEDGESGLMSAHAAGCHVIDVTFMDEYPMVEGLRLAKARDEAARTWLRE